jgi:UDPglucose 6-dehydrogenase
MKIGIVGVGFVGGTQYHFLKDLYEVVAYDKYKPEFKDNFPSLKDSSVIFVAVPTPMNEKGEIDKSMLQEAVKEISTLTFSQRPLIVIRSTTTPGTTEEFIKDYPNLDFAFNPEYLREKHALEDFKNTTRVVIGTNNSKSFAKIKEIYEKVTPHARFVQTDFKTAEIAKYFGNVMLACQITIANEFYKICEASEIKYSNVKELLLLDERIGKNIDVPGHDGDFGFGGKCFPKDLNALISFSESRGYTPKLLKEVWSSNLRFRKQNDWKNIPGATSENKKFS